MEFGDLHLSASEPRIFPGIVSRKQRRDSLVKPSLGEKDDHGSSSTNRKTSALNKLDGVMPEADGQLSDGDMEEAGGIND